MKLDYFYYRVQTEVVFTEADVGAAIRCSQRHYDHKCRAASEVGGFLYGMQNQVGKIPGEPLRQEATHGFSWEELDLLQKILEQARDPEEVALYETVLTIFRQARRESEKINGVTAR